MAESWAPLRVGETEDPAVSPHVRAPVMRLVALLREAWGKRLERVALLPAGTIAERLDANVQLLIVARGLPRDETARAALAGPHLARVSELFARRTAVRLRTPEEVPGEDAGIELFNVRGVRGGR